MSDSREKILDEAFKLFLQNSYKEVTIQDIVGKVGMTKGAFYYFFKSKEQLFREIFNNFFLSALKSDYSKFSHDSLYQFYHDFLNYIDDRGSTFNNDETGSNVNYYAFIFDALKLFPDFRMELKKVQLSELKAWEEIIRSARSKGEIKSIMSDEQISGIFIYTRDGLGMQSIMEGKIQEGKKQILALWDAFYEDLKA